MAVLGMKNQTMEYRPERQQTLGMKHGGHQAIGMKRGLFGGGIVDKAKKAVADNAGAAAEAATKEALNKAPVPLPDSLKRKAAEEAGNQAAKIAKQQL